MRTFDLIRDNRIQDLNAELRRSTWALGFRNLEFFNEDGLTPLMFAAQEDNLDAVIELLKFGANPETKSTPKNKREKAKQAHELSQDDDIVELLEHFVDVTHWNRKDSKNEINWNEVHWVLSNHPELIQASVALSNRPSIASVIAHQPAKLQNNPGYQKVLKLLATDELKDHVKHIGSYLSTAIASQNLTLIKLIIKSGVKVDDATISTGLVSTNRDIHLYFKKHFDADKAQALKGSRWNRTSQSKLNSALYSALKNEASDERTDKNVTTSQDLLSVGANPLSLQQSAYSHDKKAQKKLFYKLGFVSKEKWEALAKETVAFVKKKSNGRLLPVLAGVLAAGVSFALIMSFPAGIISVVGAELFPLVPALTPLFAGLFTGLATNAVMNSFGKKGQTDNAESVIPESVSTFAWKLVDELASRYANEVINAADLAKQTHDKMKKDAEKGERSYSSTEVHDLLIERVQKATLKVSAEDKASLLAKYGATYKESFELAKKKKDATPADLPNKDRGLKDETVTWAFQLAQAHVDKGHKKPKMESKHLQKLKVF